MSMSPSRASSGYRARRTRVARGLRQTAYRVLVAADAAALQDRTWRRVGQRQDRHAARASTFGTPDRPCSRTPSTAGRSSSGIRTCAERLEPARDVSARDCWPTAIGRRSGLPHLSANRRLVLPVFRHQFRLAKPVRHAVMFICGLGHYELHLNGQPVGDCVMDPGWTNYRRTCLYNGYDVTDRLQVGDNAIGVMLGNGMYNVTGGRYVKFTGSFGPPKLICQLHVTFADGSTQTVASDSTWRTSPGPIMFSCIYGGEDYDARREQPGWDTASFDDSAWEKAVECDGPGGRLVAAQYAPPIRVAERCRPRPSTAWDRASMRSIAE